MYNLRRRTDDKLLRARGVSHFSAAGSGSNDPFSGADRNPEENCPLLKLDVFADESHDSNREHVLTMAGLMLPSGDR